MDHTARYKLLIKFLLLSVHPLGKGAGHLGFQAFCLGAVFMDLGVKPVAPVSVKA